MVRVDDILEWLDTHAPFRYAASWDQCGLQVGDPRGGVQKVLVALDVTSRTIGEAEERHCQCLVTHHPLLFRPLNAVRLDTFPGSLVARALFAGIHLIAAHTNLDVAKDGTNAHLARLLSLEELMPLETDAAWSEEATYGGMGRVGLLPVALPFADLLERMQSVLGTAGMRVVGKPAAKVRRIALCTGSGGSLVDRAIASGADVYISGDLKYHEAQNAMEADLAMIDIGHFASERIVVEPLADYLRAQAARLQLQLEVVVAEAEQDPFRTWGEKPLCQVR